MNGLRNAPSFEDTRIIAQLSQICNVFEVMLMSIGENIKSLRESRGITQAQLGDAVGVSDKAVSTWESGKREPRMGVVEKLAEFFDVTASALLCLEECATAPASDFEKFMVEAYRRMDAEQRAFLRAALVGALTGREDAKEEGET